MSKYYKWEQSGYSGLVEASSIKGAEKEAAATAPFNPRQATIRVAPATKADGEWFMGMGGGINGEPLDPAKFFRQQK